MTCSRLGTCQATTTIPMIARTATPMLTVRRGMMAIARALNPVIDAMATTLARRGMPSPARWSRTI